MKKAKSSQQSTLHRKCVSAAQQLPCAAGSENYCHLSKHREIWREIPRAGNFPVLILVLCQTDCEAIRGLDQNLVGTKTENFHEHFVKSKMFCLVYVCDRFQIYHREGNAGRFYQFVAEFVTHGVSKTDFEFSWHMASSSPVMNGARRCPYHDVGERFCGDLKRLSNR